MLLTMTVNETHVTFYHVAEADDGNVEYNHHTRALPRSRPAPAAAQVLGRGRGRSAEGEGAGW